MAQHTDAMQGSVNEEYEDPNAGVSGPESEEAGPGVMGKFLITFTHMKEKVSKHGSTPSSPSGVQTQQHEGRVEGVPREQALPDQVHNDAVGHDSTVGARRPGGDGSVTSPVGGRSRSVEVPPRGNSHFVRDAGTPASPKVPHKDLGERIMDKLPGCHANPYSVGTVNPPQATTTTNPYTESDRSAVPMSPSAKRGSTPSSPSVLGKLKNILTGQKLSRGTATENATTGTAGTTGEQQPLMDGDTLSPTPETRGPDAGSAEAWPAPAKPDIGSIPSATRTTPEGKPIEGPTRPISEDNKKDGLMVKLMDKLHLHENSSSPRATDTRLSKETGISTPTPEATIGTATGPKEN